MTEKAVDVLVVGGGPSGLTVAAEIARSGASVLIVERRALEPISRAGTLFPRPLDLFDARGIAGRFLARGHEINSGGTLTRKYIWAGMAPLDWSALGSRFAFTLLFPQHETELLLRAWAAEVGVETRFQAELTGLVETDSGVRATIRDKDGNEQFVTAQYVVGADGGRSKTRELLGIDWSGHDVTFTGIVATAKLEFPWPGAMRPGQNEYGFCSAAAFGPGKTRFAIVHKESRKRAVSDPITAEEVARVASDILGEQVVIPELVEATRYGDAMKVAGEMRKGRAFLVGEAVRVHYPASGMGMNFCIQDAFNLGWKLAAVLKGDAGSVLLDSYESERRPIVEDLLDSVRSQVALQYSFTEEGAAFTRRFQKDMMQIPAVNAELVKELSGTLTPYKAPSGAHPAVGTPVWDFELLRRDGSTIRVYELLRDHPFLVIDLTGGHLVDASEVAGLPATAVTGHAVRLHASLTNASVIIVRPDTYLGWAFENIPEKGAIRQQIKRLLCQD